jgi:hypothetical protein
VVTTLGAPRASSKLRRGRIQALEADPAPTPLPLTRATFVRPRPFEDEASADAWLEQVCSDGELWGRLAREAAIQINRLIHAHRTAAGDPYIADIDPGRAAAVRFGFGTGEEVANGHWRRANELLDKEARKLIRRDYEALRPQERIAAVLGGRESVGVYEDLIIRARGDLDAGRVGTAALGLHAGLEALVAQGPQVDDLSDALRSAAEARRATLAGTDPDPAAIAAALRSAEAAMRRRALD